ncbi:hypothetical protein [Halalkalicoccus jeotgali]|uniref:Uncharacterized protein n=1 Tax=Halalkalicoccus jeotgali (strain DSM 18796 / CECT 7217 / JCM 14584 / KCTC 4019 / B3) TaxID=795797 RepID=D8JBL1_HALJB|nr:hypothetical protein [Halalkalicoccus jeotgali]ADJ16664.1 hypothetical protein HacjB3_16571 [Halalkalicoccus jeotgali B3]ELY39072.1 hypothetical protein C497_06159 [Halalkalicoccus jeotgali B3]
MAHLPFPLSGATLVTGPSNAGKTRLTARALDAWVAEHGTDGIVVLDFAPEVDQDGTLLGGRLTRFTDISDEVWYGVLEAYAPRTAGETEEEVLTFASANARHSRHLVESMPKNPRVVFANDVTIPFQAGEVDGFCVSTLVDYCDDVDVVVCNALESDELGVNDLISRNERATLDVLRTWTDRVIEL